MVTTASPSQGIANGALHQGVLLVAHGKPSYWDEAVTLARSLRQRSPDLRVAIASDLDVPEERWKKDGFTDYVAVDLREHGGVSFKMQLDRITPFRDATLFIDTDSICYRDIGGVFAAFPDSDFVTLGRMLSGGHWFEDVDRIRREFACDTFPFFCGDFYLFRKTPTASAVFETAREIAARHRTLGIKPLGGWCNDEPAFSLAMTVHGVPVREGVGDWILQVAHANVAAMHLDYARGHARAMLNGEAVSPRLVHFSAHRSQPLYFRERYKVFNPTDSLWNDFVARGVGAVESTAYRVRRRLGI